MSDRVIILECINPLCFFNFFDGKFKIMWDIFKKKKQSYKEEYIREAFVRLQHKVPRHGNVILKIGDRYFRCRELG